MKLLFLLKKQAGINLTELARLVGHALCEQFKMANEWDSVYYWPEEVWDEFVVAKSRIDAKLYKLTYTVTDKKVTFGDPVQVEETYVEVATAQTETLEPPSEALRAPVNPVQSASAANAVSSAAAAQSYTILNPTATEGEVTLTFQAGKPLDAKGFKWRCQVVGFGMSKTRDIWESPIFQASLPMWEGIDCYADHSSHSEQQDRPERTIRDKVGVWENFEVTAQGVDATLHLKPSAAWMAEDLLWAQQNNYLHFYGFSLNAFTMAKQVQAPDGQKARLHTQIVRPLSVDAVTMDAANGHIKVALQSRRESAKENRNMNWQMLARLFKAQPAHFKMVRQGFIGANVAGITVETSEDDLAKKVAADVTLTSQCEMLLAAADGMVEITRQTNPAPTTTTNDSGAQTTQTNPAPVNQSISTEQLPVELRDMLIMQAYSQSSLPEAAKQKIKARLGVTGTLAATRQAIAEAEEVVGTVQQTQDGFGFNNPRISIGAESRDKFAIAIAQSFELSYEEFNSIESGIGRAIRQAGMQPFKAEQATYNSIGPIESIREFYIQYTGDRDFVGVSNLPAAVRRQANYTSGDFPELFLDAMHKRLLRDYRRANYMWEKVCTIKPVKDFKTQHAILMGYFGDLPTVLEEGTYLTPSALTDTKESYALAKKGRIVTLTLEAIANDDMSAFTKIVNRLGIAAARTLAKYIFRTLIMSNPVMAADSLAVFHASHGNLITDALSSTALKSMLALLQNQTEPGSGEKFGMDTTSLNLWVPTALSLDGRSLTEAQNEPGGNDDSLAKTIRTLGISSNTQPVFDDTNDYLLTASTNELDLVEIGFFNGQREPEMFVQNDPTQGESFTNDRVMAWKIRHIYGGTVVDHRGMVLSKVAGS